MYRRVERDGVVRDWREGVHRIREAAQDNHSYGFAFLTDKPSAEYIAGKPSIRGFPIRLLGYKDNCDNNKLS